MQTGKILLVFLVGYITSLQAETLTKRSNTPLADSKPNTCQNGGTYTWIQISTLPRGPKFICTCPEGFSGIVCQFQVCDKHDCQNGTCEADQTSTRGYKCNCIEGYVGENCEVLPMDCKQIQESGLSTSGVYEIFPDGDPSLPVKVFCDLETQGGGWTAIQRRVAGSVDFNRVWDEYKNGFGDPEGDYWIGNDQIHQLTKRNDSSLYVSITHVTGTTLYELYDQFSVSDEAENYRLFLGGPAIGTLEFETDRDQQVASTSTCSEFQRSSDTSTSVPPPCSNKENKKEQSLINLQKDLLKTEKRKLELEMELMRLKKKKISEEVEVLGLEKEKLKEEIMLLKLKKN